jgi:hypothetical protein
MKIQLHSITDLITNSSTTIYTYSDASEGALREMIDEIFRVLGVNKKCDDVFTLSITLDDNGEYEDAISNMSDEEQPKEFQGLKKYPELGKAVKDFVAKVVSGEIEKPQWMKDVEGKENYNDYKPSTTLNIVSKAPEYATLAELVRKFLYSTEHESSYDG